MGKIAELLNEAKQNVTIVLDNGKYQVLADAGISKEFSEKEIADLLNKFKVDSSKILGQIKSNREKQIDIKLDDKDIKKIKLS